MLTLSKNFSNRLYMKKNLQIIDYDKLIYKQIKEDHKIGEHVFLLDEYQLSPVKDYEFIAPENMFIEVLSGKGYIVVDGVRHDVKGHSLIAYLQGEKIRVCVTSKKTVQRGAAFTNEFMEDMYHSAFRLTDIRTAIFMNPVFKLEGEQEYGMNVYVSVLRNIAKKEDNPHNLMCAKLITLALFYGPLYDVVKTRLDNDMSRRPYISSRFFELVEQHFKDKLDLSYYASEMNISKVYLHQCILASSGKPPGYWLNYHRVVYAKKCLADMNMSALQIARSLNFAGLPQFCKFFKKQTGCTPSEFRKTLSWLK